MEHPIRVLMISSEWFLEEEPYRHSFLARQYDFLKKENVQIDVFYFKAKKRLITYIITWIRFHLKLMRESKNYDLIHAQFGQSGVVAYPAKLPIVITLHGKDIDGECDGGKLLIYKGLILRRIIQYLSKRVSGIIIVSPHMEQYFSSKIKTNIIPCGLDFDALPIIDKMEARKRLNLPAEENLILFAADPEEYRKRYDLAEQSVKILNKRLSAKLIVCWKQPYENIPIYMNACDAYLMTSMSEGSPCVVKEALACNLPVVSVPVGDVKERIDGIEGCELCPDYNPENIASALERVIQRGERIRGREAVANLDESILAKKIVNVYKEAMSNYGNK